MLDMLNIVAPCTIIKLTNSVESEVNEFGRVIYGTVSRYAPVKDVTAEDLVVDECHDWDDIPF